MEQLGNAITALVQAGREVAPMALFGYFAYRILEVIAWPCVWFGLGFSVVRVIGLRLVDGWQMRQRATLARAGAEYVQQMLSADLMIERRQNLDASYKVPEWYTTATTYLGSFTT